MTSRLSYLSYSLIPELGLSDRSSRNRKRLDRNGACPFFIVENEGGISRRAQLKCATSQFDVSKDPLIASPVVRFGKPIFKRRLRISEGLPRLRIGFGVHVFMKDRQLDKIR